MEQGLGVFPSTFSAKGFPVGACNTAGFRNVQEDSAFAGEPKTHIPDVKAAHQFLRGQAKYIQEITARCRGISTLAMALFLPDGNLVTAHVGDTQIYSYGLPKSTAFPSVSSIMLPNGQRVIESISTIPTYALQTPNYSVTFLSAEAGLPPFHPLLEPHRIGNLAEIEALRSRGLTINYKGRVPVIEVRTPAVHCNIQITGCVGNGQVSEELGHDFGYHVFSPTDLSAMNSQLILMATDGFEPATYNHLIPTQIMDHIGEEDGMAMIAAYCAREAIRRGSKDNVTVMATNPAKPPKAPVWMVMMDCSSSSDVAIVTNDHLKRMVTRPYILEATRPKTSTIGPGHPAHPMRHPRTRRR